MWDVAGVALGATGAGAFAYFLYEEIIKGLIVASRCTLNGPKPRNIISGNVPEIAEKGELHEAVIEWVKNHGKVFKVRLFNRVIVMAAEPSLLKTALVTENFPKSAFYDKMSSLLGRGILLLNGQEWKSRRKIMNPGFGSLTLKALVPVFNRNTRRLRDKLNRSCQGSADGVQIDVSEEITNLTMDIIADGGFGYDLNSIDTDHNPAADAFALILRLIAHPLYNLPMMNHFFKLWNYRQLSLVDKIVSSAIEKRMKEPARNEADKDLLDIMLEAKDSDTGRKLTAQELRDEVLIFFLAGHETTATTLTWMFYELMRHPEAYRKLGEEIESVVKDKDNISFDELSKMPYTTNVLKETLRLYPPVAVSSRRVPHDIEYNGMVIPKDATMFIPPFVMQRDPEVWSNPDMFDPDRFDRPEAQKATPFHFMPFTQGPRICIGQHFFWIEAKIIVAMLFSHFDFHRVSDKIVLPTSNTGTLKAREPVMVKVKAKVNA
mmetsp:Transcript_10767/g.28236  ORF Transcript_10767/g.28236 Transcript_10767/m.28236 type:complete len:491 (-) Transcript_10767:130-1602(-)